jgi:hypothetical protein
MAACGRLRGYRVTTCSLGRDQEAREAKELTRPPRRGRRRLALIECEQLRAAPGDR